MHFPTFLRLAIGIPAVVLIAGCFGDEATGPRSPAQTSNELSAKPSGDPLPTSIAKAPRQASVLASSAVSDAADRLAVTVPNPVIRSQLRRLLHQLATDWTAARRDKARESVKASRQVLDRLMAEDPTSPDLAAIDLALQDAATAF